MLIFMSAPAQRPHGPRGPNRHVRRQWRPRHPAAVVQQALIEDVQRLQGVEDAKNEAYPDDLPDLVRDQNRPQEEEAEPQMPQAPKFEMPERIPFYRLVTWWDRIKASAKLGVLAYSMFHGKWTRAAVLASVGLYGLYRWLKVPVVATPPQIYTVAQAAEVMATTNPLRFSPSSWLTSFCDFSPLWAKCKRWAVAEKVGTCTYNGPDGRLHTSQSTKLVSESVDVLMYHVVNHDTNQETTLLSSEQQVSQIKSACLDLTDEQLVPRVARAVTSTNIPSILASHTIAGSRLISLNAVVSDRLRINQMVPNPQGPTPYLWVTAIAVTTSAYLFLRIHSPTASVFVDSARYCVG